MKYLLKMRKNVCKKVLIFGGNEVTQTEWDLRGNINFRVCQPSPEIHTFGADISKLLGASIYVVNISSLRWCTRSNSNVKVPGLGRPDFFHRR